MDKDDYQIRPVLVLDRDNTITYPLSGKEFLDSADDIGIFPGVVELLADYRKRRYLIAIATNQGGVAWGRKTEEESRKEAERVMELLSTPYGYMPGRNPLVNYYCDCLFMEGGKVFPYGYRSLARKPGYGMLCAIENMANEEGAIIDWDESLMVGDRPEDKLCANNAGVAFKWAWEFFPNRTVPDWVGKPLSVQNRELGIKKERMPCCGTLIRTDGDQWPVRWDPIPGRVFCAACGGHFAMVTPDTYAEPLVPL